MLVQRDHSTHLSAEILSGNYRISHLKKDCNWLGIAAINLCTRFEVSVFTHYEDTCM